MFDSSVNNATILSAVQQSVYICLMPEVWELPSCTVISTLGDCALLSPPPCRKLLGRYYYLTVIFVPAFLCSIPAIFVERKERRGGLAMYLLTLVSGEEREGNIGCINVLVTTIRAVFM